MTPVLRRTTDLLDRSAQDDLLQMRNDLRTVYREVSAQDGRLFPLRYARLTPTPVLRRRHARAGGAGRAGGSEDPQAPVLILPGGPERASVLPYDVLRRGLSARGQDVLMMEHRGVGLSRLDSRGRDLPAHAMDLREVIADVLEVLDHAAVERASIYGMGYGAYLAQAVAALHPERVHSLVLDSPLTGAGDERIAQATLRARYWDGTEPGSAATARAIRRLAGSGVIDARRAGPVVLSVHEFGGPTAVADLVDLLQHDRGRLTWNSVRQVLSRSWLQSTPFVVEQDLTARIAHTQLGRGSHADGGPMDPLVVDGEQARALPTFTEEPWDLHALSREITAPTLVVVGARNLVTPPRIARDLADRIPHAALLEIPGAGHSILDTRSQIAQVAARWAAVGAAHLLPAQAAELAALPASASDQALARTLRVALAVERFSPWRLRLETARAEHDRQQLDPLARRSRRVRPDTRR